MDTFGKLFRITTWGESHGEAVGVVVDGCPPNIQISEADVQRELDRRKPGQSKVATARAESDKVKILSGVFGGKTTGTSISMVVYNEDKDTKAYEKIKDVLRPGHADYTYLAKYGIRDWRGSGRASGRETVGRVAAGAIAKKLLEREGIKIVAYTKSIGNIDANKTDLDEIERNPVRCPDARAAKEMEKLVLKAKEEGDSIGGVVEVVAKNVPAGLGEPVFDKLDADISKAIVSIPAVKGVEFGAGFNVAKMMGSECNDQFYLDKKNKIRTRTNNSGGILGGISNGQDIVLRIAVKPASSIAKEQETIDTKGRKSKIKVEGRHDVCICPRLVPIAEAMVSIVLADHLLRQRTISGFH